MVLRKFSKKDVIIKVKVKKKYLFIEFINYMFDFVNFFFILFFLLRIKNKNL